MKITKLYQINTNQRKFTKINLFPTLLWDFYGFFLSPTAIRHRCAFVHGVASRKVEPLMQPQSLEAFALAQPEK